MSSLPPLNATLASSANPDGPLTRALATLFESSPPLCNELAPAIVSALPNLPPITTYTSFIDAALSILSSWPASRKAEFIAAHPRIGEQKGLSLLSAREQAAAVTPPEVLARLAHLNACYERRYPGLRYITFVNGRSRRVVMEEIEDVLGVGRSTTLSANEQPKLVEVTSVEVSGEEWTKELERAVADVARIAKSRLKSLGVE